MFSIRKVSFSFADSDLSSTSIWKQQWSVNRKNIGHWVFNVCNTISTKKVLYKKCRAFRGSIYKENRRGPKTDPCGTPLWDKSTVVRLSHRIRVFNLFVHFCKLIILFHTRIWFRAGWKPGRNHGCSHCLYYTYEYFGHYNTP